MPVRKRLADRVARGHSQAGDGNDRSLANRQLRIIGNGVVPQQGVAALRLLTAVAAFPGLPPGRVLTSRAAA